MIGDERGDVRISPDQALKLMALSIMIRDGDLDIRGHETDEVECAKQALADVAQEIALQVHNGD